MLVPGAGFLSFSSSTRVAQVGLNSDFLNMSDSLSNFCCVYGLIWSQRSKGSWWLDARNCNEVISAGMNHSIEEKLNSKDGNSRNWHSSFYSLNFFFKRKNIIHHISLPGQGWLLQAKWLALEPLQTAPPFWGAGSVQYLSINNSPPPQVVLHWLTGVHSVQPPLTGRKGH